jgi:hypothetical protein
MGFGGGAQASFLAGLADKYTLAPPAAAPIPTPRAA